MMSINPWPLICFSILIQMSVGCFIVSEFVGLVFFRRFSSAELRQLRLFTRLLVLVLSFLAVAASFFHLSKPWRSLNVLNNLDSSWLSREIMFVLVFLLLVSVSIFVEWRKTSRQRIQFFFLLIGGISGVFLVLAMSRLYMLPTVPVWNHWATPSIFILVCLLLGSQLTAASWTHYLARSKAPHLKKVRVSWNRRTLRQVETLSFVLAVFLVCGVVLFSVKPGFVNPFDEAGLRSAGRINSLLFFIRILLSLLGSLILGREWIRSGFLQTKKEMNHRLVYIVFFVFFLAEVLGRFLFYAAYFRLGL